MGQPAARVGDMTWHPGMGGGGVITSGCLTVIICGQPAARAGDMHICPMTTPTPGGPVAHMGGPIIGPGSPTVSFGGQPAARVGDATFCLSSPPGSIAPPGCPTVLIGP